MVPSPKIATYDLDPKMNAHGVAGKVVDLNTFVEDVTQQGLTWHIIAWGDTVLYTAGATIIAVN